MSRILIASSLFLGSTLNQASALSSTTAAAENLAVDVECSHIATSVGDTADCCICACGHDQCAIFKPLIDPELHCNVDAIHCYDPNEDELDEDGAWVDNGDWKGEFNESEMEIIEPTAPAPVLLQCSEVPISVGSTEDCCQCACGSDQCAVFKKFGEDLVCDPLRVYCYGPDDTETFDDAEGEWVETIKEEEGKANAFAECSEIAIPSMTETEDCCMCACGSNECAIFKSVGAELSCDAQHIHCYDDDDDEEDDDTALPECTDVAIPFATETEDCCMCACGSSNCAVFKVPGEELTCKNVHCYDDGEDDDSKDGGGSDALALGDAAATSDGGSAPAVADCSNVEIPSLSQTEDCCTCVCGHNDCAIYHGPGETLTCDILRVHCYTEDDDSADYLKEWVEDYAEEEFKQLSESSASGLLKSAMIINVIIAVASALLMG